MIEELQRKIDDLEQQLEIKTERIQELEQEVEDQSDEITNTKSNQQCYDDAILENETVAEKAFYAGVECDKGSVLRGWLNYKMEARL